VNRQHVAAVAVLLAVLAPASGCSVRPERAATVSVPADASARSDQASTAPATGGDAGRLLTAAEAKAVLPTISEMPTGWSTDPDRTVTKDGADTNEEVEPAKCAPIFDGLKKNGKLTPAVRADADFAAGALGPFLGITVKSYAKTFPTSTIDDLTAGLTACPKFTITSKGEKTTYVASAMSFPNLGDATYAVRFKASNQTITAGFDVVGIVIGQNLVQIGQVAIGGSADAKVMETVARKTLARLAK
jgi:hypothetical protein